MTDNLTLYKQAFTESFDSIDESTNLKELTYGSINEWDSVGHMGLISELEEAFNIEMEMDDVIEFNSFEKGKEILARYDISI
jgi:acyl carrier protein